MASRADLTDLPYLPPSEWRIFLVLSMKNPMTVREIGLELSRHNPDFRQGISSLPTLLHRLVTNGYVRKTVPPDSSTSILYEPLVPLEPVFRRHAERFISDFTQLRREQLELLLQIVTDRLAKLPPPRTPQPLR